jgi:hypothetical protein
MINMAAWRNLMLKGGRGEQPLTTTKTLPNNALQLTAYSLRFATASGSS